MVTSDRQIWYVKIIIFKHFFGKDGKCPQNYNASILVRYLTNITTGHSVRFLGFLSKIFFFIQKAFNLASKSLLALTKQVSTCFEDFMNIS